MKKIRLILVAMIAMLSVSLPAQAQFRFGVKAGIDVSNVQLNDLGSNFDSANRTGFTAGITTEFTVPIIGLGFDLGVMYVHRNNDVDVANGGNPDLDQLFTSEEYRKQDYLEIPLNLKYKLSIPAVSNLVAPYITTGPSIAFKLSKDAISLAYEEKKFDAAWNVGGGLQLFKHLQVGVNYSWGLTKSFQEKVGITGTQPVDIKNNGWKITAAYYF